MRQAARKEFSHGNKVSTDSPQTLSSVRNIREAVIYKRAKLENHQENNNNDRPALENSNKCEDDGKQKDEKGYQTPWKICPVPDSSPPTVPSFSEIMAEESNKMGKTKTVPNVRPKPRPSQPIHQQHKNKDTKSHPQQSPVSTAPWKSTSSTPSLLPQSFKDIQAEQKNSFSYTNSKVWSKSTPSPPPIGAANLTEIMSEQFIEKMVKKGE